MTIPVDDFGLYFFTRPIYRFLYVNEAALYTGSVGQEGRA